MYIMFICYYNNLSFFWAFLKAFLTFIQAERVLLINIYCAVVVVACVLGKQLKNRDSSIRYR